MSESKIAELYESAGVTPELAPLSEAFRFIGLNTQSIKRLAAADPAFPPLVRVSSKKVLVDIPAAAAYLRAQAGKAPRSIRGEAEKITRGEAETSAKRRAAGAAVKGRT